MSGARERARTRRELAGLAQDLRGSGSHQANSASGIDLPRATSPVVLAAIAVGAALCALGALWAWQAWSTRTSEPIDDLLPLLTVEGLAQVAESELAESGVGDAATENSEGQAEVAAPLPASAIPAPSTDTSNEPTVAPQSIIVHISGAVVHPGVVEISADARVFQAVEMAGGATLLADLDRVNLAAPMVDGERVHVPAEGEDVPPALAHGGGLAGPDDTAGAGEPTVIDINVASVDDLETLPGIGPSIATAIVQTRLDRGPFLSVDELLEVPGIGEAKLAVIAPFVTIAG